MKEIVVISGKGGTGKTSITASFAALAQGRVVVADCDVDAADLHLILKPDIVRREVFSSGYKAVLREQDCTGCGTCESLCRFDAVSSVPKAENSLKVYYRIDPVACEGCGVCERFCPPGAIEMHKDTCGEWFVSETRFGMMVHAKLGIAAENSGRLVTLVRSEAKKLQREDTDYLLIDGSPGIGCPVIASLTGADLALIVTEPTVSGNHDLRRIAGLAGQLKVPIMVCVNKWDINPDAAEEIKTYTESAGMTFVGGIRYDRAVTGAQRAVKTVVEYTNDGIAEDIQAIWRKVGDYFHENR
jgi:MinD superfamily P-loop ATPase